MREMKYAVISFLYKHFARPFFFLFEADDVHKYILTFGSFLGRFSLFRFLTKVFFYYEHESLNQKVSGIEFKNPVGLAAGFDKDADLLGILPSVGFGFSQVGTVTFKPYEGNPQPWSTRLKKSKALTVYFGLKNIGIEKVIPKVQATSKEGFPVSISVGKTNAEYTADDAAGIQDYSDGLKKVVEGNVGDFYTLNISCPNTFGGEPFTTPEKLEALLNEIDKVKTEKPIYLKMPINHSWDEFEKLCDVAAKHNVAGLIIGNLNKDREDPAIVDEIPEDIKGSISGKPTEHLVNNLISKTYQKYGDKFVLVGVGGIFSAEDAYEKIKLGATLVQLITGMIYEGPQLIGAINRGLVELTEADGYSKIQEAIGSAHK